jgi:hypothetical protein
MPEHERNKREMRWVEGFVKVRYPPDRCITLEVNLN